jgi:hypothetical protein
LPVCLCAPTMEDIAKNAREFTRSMTVVKWVLLGFNFLVLVRLASSLTLAASRGTHIVPRS